MSNQELKDFIREKLHQWETKTRHSEFDRGGETTPFITHVETETLRIVTPYFEQILFDKFKKKFEAEERPKLLKSSYQFALKETTIIERKNKENLQAEIDKLKKKIQEQQDEFSYEMEMAKKRAQDQINSTTDGATTKVSQALRERNLMEQAIEEFRTKNQTLQTKVNDLQNSQDLFSQRLVEEKDAVRRESELRAHEEIKQNKIMREDLMALNARFNKASNQIQIMQEELRKKNIKLDDLQRELLAGDVLFKRRAHSSIDAWAKQRNSNMIEIQKLKESI